MAKAVKAQDGGGHPIQQIAIVRHQHQRAGKLQQVVFEDLERGDIEIVGRLVEQQHIGRFQHQRAIRTRARSPPLRFLTG